MRHLKGYAKGFYMSLGMFCAAPLPFYIWEETYTAIMVASLPIVGLIIGTLWWLAALLLTALDIPLVLVAAALSLAPFFIAGFIHLDGYMDTSDALLSRRPVEDKLRILKDPHVGAFAVVMLGVLFLLQFSAMYAVVEGGRYFLLMIVIPVISRCCAAFAIFALPHIPQSSYAPFFKQKIGMPQKIFVVTVAGAAMTAACLWAGLMGLALSLAVIFGYAAAMAKAFKSFKGISGDLLGYALVISELSGVIALAVLQGRWSQ